MVCDYEGGVRRVTLWPKRTLTGYDALPVISLVIVESIDEDG